jgi:hypothetical protein
MLRGLSFVRHKFYIVLDSLLVLIITAGLFGCVQTSPVFSQEIIIPLVICTPESPMVNVYRATPQPWANAIFEFAFPSYIPTPIPPNPPQIDEQKILSARYAAFQQLIYETRRWSDTETIKLKDSSEVSITLTYVSPELLQAVFLNEVLKNRYPTYGFQDQLQKALNTVAARDELLFLLTVTTTIDEAKTAHQTIKIPIDSMILYNAENISIARRHDDLEENIDTSLEPVYGYLAYPLALFSASECKWTLDPKYNTNIFVTVPFIEVGKVSNETPVIWTIPYAPLISPIMPTKTPVWNLPSGFDQSLMIPLASPPSGNINQTNNWQDFARFIWGQITLGKY